MPNVVNIEHSHYYQNIPQALREEKTFIFWKPIQGEKGKIIKMPINPQTLRSGGQTNPNNFITLNQAIERLEGEQKKPIAHRAFNGIGMVFQKESNLVGFDLDDVRDLDGNLKLFAKDILENVTGFVEKSLSGNGYHIITRTEENLASTKNNQLGFEVFKTPDYYIALTGNEDKEFSAPEFPIAPVDISAIKPYIQRADQASKERLSKFEIDSQRDPNLSLQEAREMVLSIQAPDTGRQFWLSIGMFLHHQFRGDESAKEIWIEYSQQDPMIFGEFAGYDEIEYQWRSFNRDLSTAYTQATLRWYLQKYPIIKKLEVTDFPELDYTTEITAATEYVLDDFIAEGIFMIAGAAGVGKSTMLVPLAAAAAGLCAEDAELKAALQRKVIYLTEDSRQVLRILYGLNKHHKVNATDNDFKEWFRLIDTKRSAKEQIAELIRRSAKEHTVKQRTVEGILIDVPPLIVADTAAATFDLDDENNNSLVSSFISEIKVACVETGCSFWAIAHLAKGTSRSDIEKATPRGASAFEGDVNGTAYIFEDGVANTRFMRLGKTRYTPKFREISFECSRHSTSVKNRLGQVSEEYYFVGIAKPSSVENRQAKKDQKKELEIAREILDVMRGNSEGWFGREELKDLTGNKSGSAAKTFKKVLDRLIKEGEILAETVTRELRQEHSLPNAVREILRMKPAKDFEI